MSDGGKNIKWDQQDVNHDGGEGCHLDEEAHFDGFVGVSVILQKCIIKANNGLKSQELSQNTYKKAT
jgi:hypothetical protein